MESQKHLTESLDINPLFQIYAAQNQMTVVPSVNMPFSTDFNQIPNSSTMSSMSQSYLNIKPPTIIKPFPNNITNSHQQQQHQTNLLRQQLNQLEQAHQYQQQQQ
jgi:hypothetical protein